jgi:hypothetical protein
MLQHFDEVSVYGDSWWALLVILGVDLVFSGIHGYQEWKGRGAPIWRYLGAIAGTYISDGWGFLLFTVGLTLGLWGLALVGIAGVLTDDACVSAFALGTFDRGTCVGFVRIARDPDLFRLSSEPRTVLRVTLSRRGAVHCVRIPKRFGSVSLWCGERDCSGCFVFYSRDSGSEIVAVD